METLEKEIAEIKAKLEDVRKRWPLHSPKPAMFQERENLELRLAELLKLKEQSAPDNPDNVDL